MQRGARWLVSFCLQHLARLVVLMWRWTCSTDVLDDPRPTLRANKQRYVYALLHEHQLAAVIANDEKRMAAMVSRSRDGDVLSAALKATGVTAVRGSSRRDSRNKGGTEALAQLIEIVMNGEPALIAVDGPRGPRGQVRKGIVALARATDAVILPVVVRATRAWRLKATWDRPLVPVPFAHITLHFGRPLAAPSLVGRDQSFCEVLSKQLVHLGSIDLS